MTLYLAESSLGFCLFRLNGLDKLALGTPKVLREFDQFNAFKRIAALEATMLFHGHSMAWEVLQALREGTLPVQLRRFLKEHLAGKKGATLVVEDKALASLLNEALKLQAVAGEQHIEVFRAIRLHLPRFLTTENDALGPERVTRANLGLAHALARHAVQFDERRQDKPVINAHALLELLARNLNIFAMRLKESYGWHYPELAKIITDNEAFARFVCEVGAKENLPNFTDEQLAEIVGEAAQVEQVRTRARTSTGNVLAPIDAEEMRSFARYLLSHFSFRRELQGYLRDEMEKVAPNLTSLLGEAVGGKLLAHAGGLSNLAKLPASTIQILGAEKALFRALKKKGATPKYGFLYNSSYIARADASERGRVSRMLANKCALAARLDCFLVQPTARFGEEFRDTLERRLAVSGPFEEGRQNIERMEQLVEELAADGEYVPEASKRVKAE